MSQNKGKSAKLSNAANPSGKKGGIATPAAVFEAFSIDNQDLPAEIDQNAMQSGGYPYPKKMKRNSYDEELLALQIELLKAQSHVRKTGQRVVIVFEGRDTAGKGGTISRFMQHLNPRHARAVALSKPTETELGQWYFQRYISHLPTAGDIVMFDRSWYNRAGVERVMGFCNEQQLATFLREVPEFEAMLVRDGVKLFKFWLTIGREMQLKRLHARRHDPLKQWKITDIDIAAISKWADYTEAKEDLFRFTHTEIAPWTVLRANDKLRTRLNALKVVLSSLDYEGKNKKVVGKPDPVIVGSTPEFFFDA